MHKLEELKGEIKEVLQSSDEYKEYKRLEELINKNPDLKRAVDELRRENFALRYEDNLQNALEKTEQLSSQYAQISQQDMISRFLMSEICLCRLVQEICMSVAESIDFDTEFLLD